MQTFIISRGFGFASDGSRVGMVERVTVDCHRRAESRLMVEIVTDAGDRVASEGFSWWGVGVPYAVGEVESLMDRVRSAALASTRYAVAPAIFSPDPDGLLALLARLR